MTNKDIIIVLIDDTLDMCDQCIGVSVVISLHSMVEWLLRMAVGYS
jgi:hypothetical protein